MVRVHPGAHFLFMKNKDTEHEYIVDKNDHDKRLDMFLVEKIGVSRAQVQKYIHAGTVTVNAKPPRKPGDMIKVGSTVIWTERATEIHSALLDKKKTVIDVDTYGIKIVADTPEYVVINKPAGLLVHETNAHETDTVVRWLLAHYPQIAGVGEDIVRPGIVHRLDREASGLMVVAKTQKMFDHLKKQFQDRTIDKEYAVLGHEVVAKDHDVIDFDIDHGVDGRMVARPKIDMMKVKNVTKAQPGKVAKTEFFVVKRFTRFTLLSVKIHTGRTHQIRVHLFAYNHPVVGDTIYMNPKLNRKRDQALGRLFLHAEKLGFTTLSDERVCFEASLPKELKNFLKELK